MFPTESTYEGFAIRNFDRQDQQLCNSPHTTLRPDLLETRELRQVGEAQLEQLES
jgi:hypothetical protein